MPFGIDRKRVESNNAVKLDGTYEFEIVDAWLYNVVEETAVSPRTGKEYTKREYVPELTNNQDVQLKLRVVKRPDIVVSDTLRVYVGKKSKFAQLMTSLVGVPPGDDLIAYLLADRQELDVKATSKLLRQDICTQRVICKMVYDAESGYTRVKGYMATPDADADGLESIPLQTNPGLQKTPLTPAQQASEDSEELFGGPEDEIPF